MISVEERVDIVIRAMQRRAVSQLTDEALSEEVLLAGLPDERMTLAHKLAECGILNQVPVASCTVRLFGVMGLVGGVNKTVAQTAFERVTLPEDPGQLRLILGKVGRVSVDQEFKLRAELKRQGIDINQT